MLTGPRPLQSAEVFWPNLSAQRPRLHFSSSDQQKPGTPEPKPENPRRFSPSFLSELPRAVVTSPPPPPPQPAMAGDKTAAPPPPDAAAFSPDGELFAAVSDRRVQVLARNPSPESPLPYALFPSSFGRC